MATDFLGFARAYYQDHPGADSNEMVSAWHDLELSQQLNDAQNIDAGALWDSINRQKDWMGPVGDLSWGQLAPEDQATLSSLLSSNPNVIFQNVEGRSFLVPDAITTRTVGDNSYQEVTPFTQRADAYFGNYYAPTQADMLYRLAPDIAAKYGITGDTVAQDRAFQSKAAESRDSAEWSGMNREAALMAAIVLSVGAASGAFSGAEAAGGAAEGGSAYGSLGDIAVSSGGGAGGAAGYTGTASELAADGLGGVDMGAGSTAYYDSGAGMWIDSSTGAGISSGAEVPAGYAAESGSSAIAAQDAAAISAEGSGSGGLWDQAKSYYSKGSNANSLAKALGSLTNSPSVSMNGGGFDPLSATAPSGLSGGGSGGSSGSAGMMLENPTSSYAQISSPAQQQSNQFGLIDVSPASNAFNMAGATWNQRMANALRGK